MTFRQRPRNTSVFEKVWFIAHCSRREHIPWGTTGHLSKKVLERTHLGLELWVGDFEEGTKKREYTLEWGLLESRDNFINKSYL